MEQRIATIAIVFVALPACLDLRLNEDFGHPFEATEEARDLRAEIDQYLVGFRSWRIATDQYRGALAQRVSGDAVGKEPVSGIGPHQLVEPVLGVFVVYVHMHMVAVVDGPISESAGEPIACVDVHVRQNVEVDPGHRFQA
jgi:hypothetical protein